MKVVRRQVEFNVNAGKGDDRLKAEIRQGEGRETTA